jgi:two-component system, NtrC family, sensor kinase
VTFKQKLFVAFGVMTVPLAIIGVQTISNVRAETAALKRLEASLGRTRIFADVESTLHEKVSEIRDHLSGQDPDARLEYERLNTTLRRKLAEWKAGTVDPEDLSLANTLEQLDLEIDSVARRIFTFYEEGRREQAFGLVQQHLNRQLLPELDRTVKRIYAGSRTRSIQRAVADVEATARSTTTVLIVIVLASVVFSLLFTFVIARTLARPIERLKVRMDRVGEGDFDQARAVDIASGDEIGGLARTFVRMAERLRGAQDELRHKIDTLRDTQAQLIQSEKLASLGQMAAAVAHGLRNPLASIRAATQLTRHQLPPASPLREHLTAVIHEVDRLEKRIVHLLDFAKPVAFSPVPTPVRDLIDGAVSVFAEKIAAQGVKLTVDVDPALVDAWVDPAQIEQALIEVIANALEAMPHGGALVVGAGVVPASGPGGTSGSPGVSRSGGAFGSAQASGSAHASGPAVSGGPDRPIEISIEDTGEGIAADALPRVTEAFFSTKADGTGLGLAIAKRFVAQNRGDFTIASLPGQGTRVSIALPALTAAPVPEA